MKQPGLENTPMLRRPPLLQRTLILLALMFGLLAPAWTLIQGPAEPLTGVCRSPDAEQPASAQHSHWFEHCAACGSLSQTWGPAAVLPESPWALVPEQAPPLRPALTPRSPSPGHHPPSRAPPMSH